MDRLLARISRRQSAGPGSACPGNRPRPRETKKATGGVGGCQPSEFYGRAYSHRIPLANLKCLSEKRQWELAARLGGEPGGARIDSAHGHRSLFRPGAGDEKRL